MMVRVLLIIIAGAFLAGCGYISDRSQTAYLKSQSIKPMTVPKGMSSSSISSRFPVPPAPQGETLQQPVDLMPPTVS